MSDPRQLAEEALDERNQYDGDYFAPRVARELLSALDALEAANKEASPRTRDEMFARTLRGIENELDHVSTERDRLAEALQKSAERLHGLSEDPEHLRHVFSECPAYECVEARSALAGGGPEPQHQEQDLGTTASQSSVVKGEKA